MFKMFGKKKAKGMEVHAVATGKVIPITEVSDPVFSQKMMGDGYAVIPTNGEVFAPLSGKVLSVFPTKHAIAFEGDNGLEFLVHMGIDTVDLKGGPFEVHVTEGEMVTSATKIATVNLEELAEAVKKSDLITVFTNFSDVAENLKLSSSGQVNQQEVVGEINLK